MGWTQNPPVLGTLQVRFLFPAPISLNALNMLRNIFNHPSWGTLIYEPNDTPGLFSVISNATSPRIV